MALLYDTERQRDYEVVRFINEGLAGGQLCIYGTVHAGNEEYFKTISSRITDYDQNVKNGNLIVIDFMPFYLAAVNRELAPYKEVQRKLEEMFRVRKDLKVRYVGDATGYLFMNKHFAECAMIEQWWQQSRIKAVTTLCLFQKSLTGKPPYTDHLKDIIDGHDLVVDAKSNSAPISVVGEPIPAEKLKEILGKLEELIGRAYAEHVVEEFRRLGIDLSSKTESYFLHEIREAMDILFGIEASELLMERLKREVSN